MNNSETQSEYYSQNVSQNTENQSKAEDIKTEPKPVHESGHYWWCPIFGHLPNCQYLNFGFHDQSYWQQMANQYSMPFIQMPTNNTERPSGPSSMRHRDQSLKPTPNKRIPKESPKIAAKNSTEIERLYSCKLCDQLKETKDMTSLRQHIENHLGRSRPFECLICGKEFKFRSNCRNHIIAHSVVRKHIRRVSAHIQN